MRFLSLFAGIGGFDLGLERAGMECAGQVELDEYCIKVLEKHWPNVKRMTDVTEVMGNEFGPVDLICGGYPCQPESSARQHKNQVTGFDDARWLWPEVNRILDKARPDWFVGENVFNHINMGLDKVLSDLEGLSYTARAFVIPAAAIGANHRRERVWILANANSKRWQGLEDGVANRCSGLPIPGLEQGRLYKQDNLPLPMDGGYCNPSSGVQRNDNGLSEGMDRLKCLGNAVVPQIPEIIGRAILAAEGKTLTD